MDIMLVLHRNFIMFPLSSYVPMYSIYLSPICLEQQGLHSVAQ
jgi:hypothetical protein